MPIFESSCASGECPQQGVVMEWIGKCEDSDPLCECGSQMTRMVSRFGVIWTGPLTRKYLDTSLEGAHGDGGHWAYRTKNTKSGKAEPCYIETFQQQREYCKEEGLAIPSDTDFATISPDGKTTNRITRSEALELKAHTAHEDAKQLNQEAAAAL